jgi:hypothetical protein
MTEKFNKSRMNMTIRGVAELATRLEVAAKRLDAAIDDEFFGSGTTTFGNRDSSASVILAHCLIVRTLSERIDERIAEMNKQTEILVTGPVLERCT